MNGGDDMAFPLHIPEVVAGPYRDDEKIISGLTKRELFAAMAMQGMISNDYIAGERYDQVAHRCVQQADALLAELAK